MKKAFLPLLLIGVLIVSLNMVVQADVDSATLEKKVKSCPKVSDLAETSFKDREELMKVLETLIPDTYVKGDEYGDYYKDWTVTTLLPLPMTINDGSVDVYYEIAKNFCGKEVAERSWIVQLHFAKWEGVSASNTEGQIFVAKSNDKGWHVWYRYH